ncbi:unnamed protein product [Pieris macdunnoughi]|uniref:Uncharacterized protein n=1 Tax=Pieris macdunnoughi TaxID=345717 RepID=A0A821U778_9NEOP|nr:unnamed protein product [Pieris macdunnoughi]
MVLKTQKFTENDTVHQDSVVISGMAGLYPQSHNVKEFKDILYNKVNPIKPKETRWKYNHPEVANSTGKVPELEYFDAQFFKIHYRLGNSMDSMSKKILEQAFDAIYDAGISPDQLSGTKVGVYLGTCFSETEKACFYVATSRTGFGIAGCSKSMFANRISYWLNAKGPSMSVDQACCSSTVALELAYQALIRGEVDSAIVGGANICLHPQSTVHYGRIMTISKDGVTKSFDKNAHGCAKSEAINVLFLQRAKDALRIYAEVVHVKSEFCGLPKDEDGPLFTFYRDPCIMADFLKTFYEEANVPPQAVEYVEAFGSATPKVDKAELEAIDRVFCDNREDTLLVGSVMSNLGYVEAASGISSVTKVLLGYEAGKLAGNINCDDPIDDVEGIRTGKMQIVRDHEPFRQGYTAVNGVSVTGVNAHVLLRGLNKTKNLNRYKSNIPHIVAISGRQKSAVEKIFEDLKKRPIDPEEIALFHNIHQTKISGHLGRGYILLDTNQDNETVVLSETADYFDDVKRPLWFVYSGMGSQWAGMGAQLMRIPVFAAAIERCRRALEPKGIDILHIITAPDKKIYDNILHSFVGIAAVQIGLTDVLKEMGIVPDKIIGHSVGELGCAYADGCLTAEEMILAAYSRGLVSVQTPFIRGSMAAVGIGYEKIIKLCPPEIEVACHNSSESSTISGPADAMKQFVESLTSKGVFAKEVPCSNIAYHSRYIAEAGPGLLKYLKEVIPTPRARTERWVSTSIPQERWEEPLAKYSSAEYHTNNLLCPVLFEESAQLIPKNAVLLEVAPHGLLQAILKRSLSSCVNIPLTRRGHPDNVTHMLDAIGKLYMQGYYPKVQALYPKVEFPVSTGTPMLGHLIEWAHTEKWNLPLYVSAHRKAATACKFVLSVHDEEYHYLQGHVIRGQNLLPFSAALVAVWDTLAMFFGIEKKHTSIQFKSIQFYAQPVLHDGRQLTLNVAIQRGSGKFEVSGNSMLMASGYAEIIEKDESHRLLKIPVDKSTENTLKMNDIYKLLHSRDYQYSGEFRSLLSVNTSMTQAEISWKDNWVAFIDALIQLNNVRRAHNTVSIPDSIRKLTIEIDEHKMNDNKILRADVIDIHDCTRCGGVVIESLTFRDLPISNNEAVTMKSLKFVPNFMPGQSNELTALYVYLQIIAENVESDQIDAIELIENNDGISKFKALDRVLLDIPEINMKYKKMHYDVLYKKGLGRGNAIFVTNLSNNDKLTKAFDKYLPPNTLIVNKEYSAENKIRPSTLYTVLCNHHIEDKLVLQLIRWKPDNTIAGTSALTVRSDSNLSHLISTLKFLPAHQKLLIFSPYPSIPNLENFVMEWRKEGRKVNLIMINHSIDEQQFVEDLPKTDLAINVLDHGTWGGKYYVPMKASVDHRRDAMLQSASVGDFSSLHWVAASNLQEPGVNVKVHYAGVNDLDVKRASGVVKFAKNSTKTYFGMDFSGTTASGSKVMGLIAGGSISSRVSANPNLLWPVPEHWTLEEAATVPLAYCQAFYCLAMKNRFFPGKTVLIHGGTGSLGQAAIALCLAYKCEIFSTVSNRRKKEFLLKLFPTLKEENIGYSRDSTFGDMILTKTKEKGCDIVLSCVKGELKNISISSCGAFGIIIDTGLIHNHEDYNFGMHSLTKERSYKLVDFSSMFEFGTIEEFKRLQALVSEGIALGYVRPLTRIVYSPKDVSRAFRLIDDSKHRGRVLIDLQQNIPIERASLQVSPEMSHLVISDDDILATQLIDRLVDRGVRKVRLVTSQSDIVLYKKMYWSKTGVNIEVINLDIWNTNNIPALLKDLNIEGVYTIVTKDTIFDKVNEFLKDLDLKTRELDPTIRYFAVINENSGIGEHVSLLRKKNRLATSLVRLPCLKMRDIENDCKMSMRSAIDIIEKALLSQEAVIMAHRVSTKVNLLEDIAKWADIKLPQNVDSDSTLLDLGMHESKTKAVQFCLRDHYNLWFLEEEIPNITIERIRETEEKLLELQYTDEPGLSSFFSYVDSDELLATTEMTFLPTLTSSSSMRDDEFDPDQAFLCIVPGVEGHHLRFTELCERLKLPALVLQPGLGKDESLQDIAKRFAKCLLSRTELKKHFYLMGYETGVIIALEMAAILEDNGLTGVVYCLGGTPNEIVAQFDSKLTEIKDDVTLQESVGKHMVKLMSGENTNSLDEKLNKATTWEERVTYCVRDLIGRVSYSTQYTKELIEAAYSRIMQVKKYAAKPQKLRSLLILMRANFDEELKNDSLQQYSQQPIIKYQLKAPLCYAAQDLRCAAIINKHLEEDLIEAFDKRNLCETYLLNADTFMTAAVENVDS